MSLSRSFQSCPREATGSLHELRLVLLHFSSLFLLAPHILPCIFCIFPFKYLVDILPVLAKDVRFWGYLS